MTESEPDLMQMQGFDVRADAQLMHFLTICIKISVAPLISSVDTLFHVVRMTFEISSSSFTIEY